MRCERAVSISFFFFCELASIEQDAGEGLAVHDRALVDHFEHIGQFDEAEFDLLVFFRVCVAGDQAFGDEDLHGFAEKAGAGVVLDQRLPFFGA